MPFFSTPCPLCLNEDTEPFFSEGPHEYFTCGRCSLKFLHPSCRPAPEKEKERYLQHENDVTNLRYQDFVRPLHDYITGEIPQGALGLDFGAGTGPVLAAMLEKSGYHLRLYDPYFHPRQEHLETTYDFIAACEVVEHLFHPAEEFKKLRALLRPGGTLGIMTLPWTPEVGFSDWRYRRDFTHVAFYSRETFFWIKENFAFSELHFSGPRVMGLRA